MAFTSGPWTADWGIADEFGTRSDWTVFAGDSESHGPVCSLRDADHYRPQKEIEANARLIAAAPDLLAACEQLIAWADRLHDTTGRSAGGPVEAIASAHAAIAKARGES